MKKFMVFVLALLCVSLVLTACGAKEDSSDKAQTDRTGNPSISYSDETTQETENQEPDATVIEGISISQREMDGAKDAVSAKSQELMEEVPSAGETIKKEQIAMKMNVQVGAYIFTATLEDNDAVRELMEMMQAGPVTINMSDYSGFEKVGPLGRSLSTSNSQTTTAAGDIVLYNGNNIVMFYGSNSWSYTRIGKIDDLTDWTAALGSGDITAIFTLAE